MVEAAPATASGRRRGPHDRVDAAEPARAQQRGHRVCEPRGRGAGVAILHPGHELPRDTVVCEWSAPRVDTGRGRDRHRCAHPGRAGRADGIRAAPAPGHPPRKERGRERVEHAGTVTRRCDAYVAGGTAAARTRRASERRYGRRATPCSVTIPLTRRAGVTSKARFSAATCAGAIRVVPTRRTSSPSRSSTSMPAPSGVERSTVEVGAASESGRSWGAESTAGVYVPILLATSPFAAIRSAPTTTA